MPEIHEIFTFNVHTVNQGLLKITHIIRDKVQSTRTSAGLCTVFIRHTSASLVIQENADSSARRDLENWICKLVPESDPLYTHTLEGPDDMPAHIKAMLTATSLSIPIRDGDLLLGIWQGIFLFEHRHGQHSREIVVHVSGSLEESELSDIKYERSI